MRNAIILVLSLCLFVGSSTASVDYFDTEDEPRSGPAFDRLDLLRKYAWENRGYRRDVEDEFENWEGRWMPDRPNEPTPPPKIYGKGDVQFQDYSPQFLHGVPMGQPSKDCDDAKTNLTTDWDRSPVNYTCYGERIVPSKATVAAKYCERIPKNYMAMHRCMHQEIRYDDDIPLFGTHRPLWPVYGEYKFLPRQRWLHSLEHGGIVMLYHPCANPLEIKRLKSLVAGCLRRHVITPYNLLSEDRPLALVAWGCRLTMSYVNPAVVTNFIRRHALRGPEETPTDGHFTDQLLSRAKIVSDEKDSILCPDSARS